MSVPAFTDPASDFSDGLKVLSAYHDSLLLQGKRLLEWANTLLREGCGLDRSVEAVRLAGYYCQTTQLHHRDEERCLFPLIINKSFLIDGMIERLALDHEEIEAHWAELADCLQAQQPLSDPLRCVELVQRFEHQLKEHIEREDLDFFPEVERLLSPEQRFKMGGWMARLRRLG